MRKERKRFGKNVAVQPLDEGEKEGGGIAAKQGK